MAAVIVLRGAVSRPVWRSRAHAAAVGRGARASARADVRGRVRWLAPRLSDAKVPDFAKISAQHHGFGLVLASTKVPRNQNSSDL